MTKINVESLRHHLLFKRPETREELATWVTNQTGLLLPRRALCASHQTPLDYLADTFFEEGVTGDATVWACRGGGKTMIGALATLLDLVFKPGIQIRILGGSLEQSDRMYAYLRTFFEGPLRRALRSPPTRRKLARTGTVRCRSKLSWRNRKARKCAARVRKNSAATKLNSSTAKSGAPPSSPPARVAILREAHDVRGRGSQRPFPPCAPAGRHHAGAFRSLPPPPGAAPRRPAARIVCLVPSGM